MQDGSISPITTANNQYVAQHAPKRMGHLLCWDTYRYMGSTVLAAPASHKAQGRSASGRNGGARKTTSSNSVVMRISSNDFVLVYVMLFFRLDIS